MIVSLLLAMDAKRAIGYQNKLPWHLPEDLAFFRRTTMGHVIVMGRKTYESIGRPLPGRHNVIVTTQKDYSADGCTVLHSVGDVLSRFSGEKEIFVIGGTGLFTFFLPYADRMYITEIQHTFHADIYFPQLNSDDWLETSRQRGPMNEKNPYVYDFVVYDRKERLT